MKRHIFRHCCLAVLVIIPSCLLEAATLRHLFAGALSYAVPSGELADFTAAQPALGFSLGYLYRSGHHTTIGVKGTWTQMHLGKTTVADFSDYGITHVGVYGTGTYRLFREGWSPYTQIDAGMGFIFADQIISNQPVRIPGLSEVKVSIAAGLGILIPVSERVDADVSGRWFHTYVTDGFTMLGIQIGLVYALR